MVRPPINKIVENKPKCEYFKPSGLKVKEIKQITLTYEEFEALRLKDYENLQQTQAAEEMGISQPTFNRVYNNGKKKLVKAIIESLAIKICGGNYKMPNRDRTGPDGEGPMTGRGLGLCRNTDNTDEEQNFKRGFGNGLGRGRGRRLNRTGRGRRFN